MRRLLAVVLCVALPAAAQNVIPARIEGQPLVYTQQGKLTGCGVRLIIADEERTVGRTVPAWDISYNLYAAGHALVKAGTSDVTAKSDGTGTQKRATVESAWLKAPGADATSPIRDSGKSNDEGYILYATSIDPVLDLFRAQVDGADILIGTRRKGATSDRIFAGAISMSPAETKQVATCLAELVDKMLPPKK